jgi:hypothetical protein
MPGVSVMPAVVSRSASRALARQCGRGFLQPGDLAEPGALPGLVDPLFEVGFDSRSRGSGLGSGRRRMPHRRIAGGRGRACEWTMSSGLWADQPVQGVGDAWMASKRSRAGSVPSLAGFSGVTHGHGRFPKNAGLDFRYSEGGSLRGW